MRYRMFILPLTFVVILNCKGSPLSSKEPPDYGLGWNFIYWYIIDPELKRREQCSQPNAISHSYVNNDGKKIYCLTNKVSQGLIYDANTNLAIIGDTLPPGQSFLCKCPPAFNGGQWQRGVIVEDNPSPGVAISFIQYTKNNIALQYPSNYNQKDNLYCITQCSATDLNTAQYQFLKIR